MWGGIEQPSVREEESPKPPHEERRKNKTEGGKGCRAGRGNTRKGANSKGRKEAEIERACTKGGAKEKKDFAAKKKRKFAAWLRILLASMPLRGGANWGGKNTHFLRYEDDRKRDGEFLDLSRGIGRKGERGS